MALEQTTRDIVIPLLTLHENKKQFPYDDADGCNLKPGDKVEGKITIGIGRNLTDVGLSEMEIQYLFENDLKKAEIGARSLLGNTNFDRLTPRRQAVLIDMCFNMGRQGLAGFTKFLQALRDQKYIQAAIEMRHSLWYTQTGSRAVRLAQFMEQG